MMYDRINAGEYRTKLEWPDREDPNRSEMAMAYMADERRLWEKFKADVLADIGLTGHPKAVLLFSKALELCQEHNRDSNVYDMAKELAELVR